MLLADFGTTYCKLLDTLQDTSPRIIASRDLKPGFQADLATGHNAARRSKRSAPMAGLINAILRKVPSDTLTGQPKPPNKHNGTA